MRLRVCHGILGEELFDLQEADQEKFGWDLMTRTADVLNLLSPFQVVIYAQATSKIQSPLHALRLDPEMCESTFCYIVQSLQTPTACVSQDLLAAVSCRDVHKLSYLLGKGIDLRGPDTEIGPISTILASAILADHSSEQNADHMNLCPILDHGTGLTYLLLQSLANPNVLPRLDKPQFLHIDPHFVRKGCSRTSPAQVKSQFFRSFCASILISCERVAPRQIRHK